MAIKVISGNVIHNGESVGIGGVITDIDKENAERLCKEGLCEVVSGVDVDGDIGEAESHEEEIDLETMTKPELIEFAESIGVELDGKETKAKLIEKISSVDAPNTEFPQ